MTLEDLEGLVEQVLANGAETAQLSLEQVANLLGEAGIDVSSMTEGDLQHLLDYLHGEVPAELNPEGPVEHPADPGKPRFGGGRCFSCSGTGTWWTPGSGTTACRSCGGSGVG
jgi:hypothetical protein